MRIAIAALIVMMGGCAWGQSRNCPNACIDAMRSEASRVVSYCDVHRSQRVVAHIVTLWPERMEYVFPCDWAAHPSTRTRCADGFQSLWNKSCPVAVEIRKRTNNRHPRAEAGERNDDER